MATWAFTCTRCGAHDTQWFVAADAVAEFPADTHVVHVKVGNRWLCATLDRSQPTTVEAGLIRMAVPADAADCDDCRDR